MGFEIARDVYKQNEMMLSDENGQILARFVAVAWSEDADENITVCFNVTIRKGPEDALPAVIYTPHPRAGMPTASSKVVSRRAS